MPSVTIIRKRKPVQIDRQVYSFCLKNKRQRRLAKAQRGVVDAILDHFCGDTKKAQDWLEHSMVPPYGLSVREMLIRGNVKALRRHMKHVLKPIASN